MSIFGDLFQETTLTYKPEMEDKEERLRELILYIANKCVNDSMFGATKLNKILFKSDFLSFEMYGTSISGASYKRLDHGPVPASLLPIRAKMEEEAEIFIKKIHWPNGKVQHKVIAMRESDLTYFSGRDIAIVDTIISALKDMNAEQASEYTHGIQWKTCYNNDPIPYETAFLSDEPVTLGDISRTEELLENGIFDVN